MILTSHALQNRARGFADVQLGRAFPAQPHHHARRVNPIKRCYFAGHFHGGISLQALQCLNKKHSVINFAVASLVPMYTLSLKKELLHGGYPSLAPHRASVDKKTLESCRVLICYLRIKQGRATKRESSLDISGASCHGSVKRSTIFFVIKTSDKKCHTVTSDWGPSVPAGKCFQQLVF